MPVGEKEAAKARRCFLSSNGWKCHKNPIHGAKGKPFCAGELLQHKTHLTRMKGPLSKRKAPKGAENKTLVFPSHLLA